MDGPISSGGLYSRAFVAFPIPASMRSLCAVFTELFSPTLKAYTPSLITCPLLFRRVGLTRTVTYHSRSWESHSQLASPLILCRDLAGISNFLPPPTIH